MSLYSKLMEEVEILSDDAFDIEDAYEYGEFKGKALEEIRNILAVNMNFTDSFAEELAKIIEDYRSES